MLKIRNVTKAFNKSLNPEDLKIALNDISLDIKEGEFISVIGSNGSGKSTLLNVISGSLFVDKGEIIIDGKDVTHTNECRRSKHVGFVFQDPLKGTAANMSVLENLLIAHRRAKRKTLKWGFNKHLAEDFKRRVKELNLGLETRLNQKIGLLSGGQRQALTLLMSTLDNPSILLLDEHTAALDPKTAKSVLELTEKIVIDNNLTTIMVTHNMKDALRYGDRLLMFNEGKIIVDVSGEEKSRLTINDLLKMFEGANVEISDQMLLAKGM